MRGVAYVTGAAMDNAVRQPDADARKRHQAFVDFMIPIVKGCSTEVAQQVTYLAVQVHGGMGFIEETGAAQHYRDARITTIYEGTTGIQANDLVGRKVAAEKGMTAKALIEEMRAFDKELAGYTHAALVAAKKLAANEGDADFLRAKIATSHHFADHALAKAPGLRDTVVAGAASVLALPEAQF